MELLLFVFVGSFTILFIGGLITGFSIGYNGFECTRTRLTKYTGIYQVYKLGKYLGEEI